MKGAWVTSGLELRRQHMHARMHAQRVGSTVSRPRAACARCSGSSASHSADGGGCQLRAPHAAGVPQRRPVPAGGAPEARVLQRVLHDQRLRVRRQQRPRAERLVAGRAGHAGQADRRLEPLRGRHSSRHGQGATSAAGAAGAPLPCASAALTCTFSSTSDTSAIGTLKTRLQSEVMSSNRASGSCIACSSVCCFSHCLL